MDNATAWVVSIASSQGSGDTSIDQHACAQTIASSQGWTVTKTLAQTSDSDVAAGTFAQYLYELLEATPPTSRPTYLVFVHVERYGSASRSALTQLQALCVPIAIDEQVRVRRYAAGVPLTALATLIGPNTGEGVR